MKFVGPLVLFVLFFLLGSEARAQQTDPTVVKQRAAADSSLVNYYNPAMAKEEMANSKQNKLFGYTLLIAGSGLVTYAITSDKETLGIFLLGCLAMGVSNPLLTQGSRSKGRAEIFAMDPQMYSNPEKRAQMISKYKSTATGCTIGGWVLFVGGLATFTVAVSSFSDNEAGLIAGTGLMMASLPVWMTGAKNKGRLSVLSGRYSNGRNLSMVPAQRGIGIGITLGK